MERTILIGTLRWSEDGDHYIVETDDGGLWILNLPELMVDAVDRMSHMRVMVEGGLIGLSIIRVSAVVEAE